MWFMAKDTGPFARLLDIGEKEGAEGRAFIYFTPRTADDQSRAAITATDWLVRVPLDNARLDDGKPHMVAIVIDRQRERKCMFSSTAKNPSRPRIWVKNTLDKVRPVGNLIGKSSFDNDPGLSANNR